MFGPNALEAAFRSAANDMLRLHPEVAQTIPEEDRLACYKYYKQSTIGNINVPQPQFLDQKANKKWWAWSSVKGMNQDDAMKAYIKTTAPYRLQNSK